MNNKEHFLNKIRVRNGYSIDDFAEILGITKQGFYNLTKTSKPLPRKYFDKIKSLLTQDDISNFYHSTINYTNSIINSNQSNRTNYNNIQKQDNTIISINYYQNITDFSKNQNAIKLDCPVNILFSLINNKQVQDYSKLVICKDNNETYIIDTSSTTPTDKPQLCIVENKIDINNTTCFSAMVRRDVLTNKLIMSIAGQPEIEMLKTCSIIGIVVCRII